MNEPPEPEGAPVARAPKRPAGAIRARGTGGPQVRDAECRCLADLLERLNHLSLWGDIRGILFAGIAMWATSQEELATRELLAELLEDAGFQVLRPWHIPDGSAASGVGIPGENAES